MTSFWLEIPRGLFVVVLGLVFVFVLDMPSGMFMCMENASFTNSQGATRAGLIVCDMM
jgi:hypothetical protein